MGEQRAATIDYVLPHWHFRESHGVPVPGQVAVEQVMHAVMETTWGEAPLSRALMSLTKADVSPERRIVSEFLSGAGEVVEAGDQEFLFVALDCLRERPKPQGSVAEALATCDEPGFLKIAMNIRYDGRVLSTETRVFATDEATRRKFRTYWLVIRPASGLSRKSMLRAIRRRALRDAATA
ncbi:hypothetical protein ACIRYZ_32245 [Kitasatospora sp. NPDC101155]|uniref:hypothetical protein n=1 Tax=Kitasatospora sp. NPDC101155 TaxID=3364097 RepID=UPI003830321A